MRAAKPTGRSGIGRGQAGLLLAIVAAIALFGAGCGTPGAPQPPSLNLPQPVTNLAATRAGNAVTLTWTIPRKSTDKLLLKGMIPAQLCRGESIDNCESTGGELFFTPGAEASFTERLSERLAAGAPRPLRYWVQLQNRKGRSAGWSNAAVLLAGEAPAAVLGLKVEMRRDGAVVHWEAPQLTNASGTTASIRLHRRLLTAEPQTKSQSQRSPHGFLEPAPEPMEASLLAESCGASRTGQCRTLDKAIHFGESYEYRAQRVVRVVADGRVMELEGELSAPVRVEALDVFPPSVPKELVAVASLSSGGHAEAAIDLSWLPVVDDNLAGYAVYRLEVGDRDGNWKSISSAQLILTPAFHDAGIEAGHRYRYAVTSIARNGHESGRSAEAEESVPAP